MNTDNTEANTKRIHESSIITEDLNTKKLKMSDNETTTVSLTAKQKKKASRARKLGMLYEIVDNELVIQPKISFKAFSETTLKDVRTLLATTLSPSGKQSRIVDIPDFPGVESVKKVVLIDAPIFDPTDMELPIETTVLTATNCAQIKESAELYQFIKQQQETEEDILGLIYTNGFDQYKRLNDRFLDILQVPLSKGAMKKKRSKENEMNESIKPEVLILDENILKMEDFSIHASQIEDDVDWIDTLVGENKQEKELMAIDCEMCKTVNGYAITSVALIDRDHKVLINELVKPYDEIVDYVTHISGVDEKSLRNVTTTLGDIQKKIQSFVTSDTILVGHGLVNDLKCLKMRHPYIIDTSIIYHHKNGPPYKPSLRDLTLRYLNRTIQSLEQDRGHDPLEDAIASLELLELKLKHGLSYGLSGLSQIETIIDYFNRTNHHCSVIQHNMNMTNNLIIKNELSKHREYITCESDQQVVDKIIEQQETKDIILSRLDLNASSEEERRSQFLSLFGQLYQKMPKNTAFYFITGCRSNPQYEQLREKRVEYKRKLKKIGLSNIPMEERWSIEEEELLEHLAEKIRRGCLFSSLKN